MVGRPMGPWGEADHVTFFDIYWMNLIIYWLILDKMLFKMSKFVQLFNIVEVHWEFHCQDQASGILILRLALGAMAAWHKKWTPS